MDDYDKQVIKEFLESEWAAFEAHCQEREVDAEKLIEELDEL